jgi:glycosyltransferase involved in cell wall biosynthesis
MNRVLIFCDIYLPSLAGGGGTWAVASIVERFSDRYEFFIVTGNRVARTAPEKIQGVKEAAWNTIGEAQVYYIDERRLNDESIRNLISEVNPDFVFLNSVFSTQTVRYLQARNRRAIENLPTILAPCGELLPGALAIKAFKKKVFIAYAKLRGLFRGVIWRASFESERESIRKVVGGKPLIKIAADLTPKTILPEFDPSAKPLKSVGFAKIAFLARIARKKNLKYLLERLRDVSTGNLELEIIGPLEDRKYWAECSEIIDQLPANIRVTTVGAIDNSEALGRLTASHFFVMPTLSENFGYVFIEALAAGCPLLISDQTDWGSVESAGAGWIIPLEDPAAWTERLNNMIQLPQAEFESMSAAAREFSVSWLADPSLEAATGELFRFALQEAADE